MFLQMAFLPPWRTSNTQKIVQLCYKCFWHTYQCCMLHNSACKYMLLPTTDIRATMPCSWELDSTKKKQWYCSRGTFTYYLVVWFDSFKLTLSVGRSEGVSWKHRDLWEAWDSISLKMCVLEHTQGPFVPVWGLIYWVLWHSIICNESQLPPGPDSCRLLRCHCSQEAWRWTCMLDCRGNTFEHTKDVMSKHRQKIKGNNMTIYSEV